LANLTAWSTTCSISADGVIVFLMVVYIIIILNV